MIYLVLKSLHVISVISWMAGIFYLPRLFVYHSNATPNGEHDLALKYMEYKLYKIIMLPAMIATLITGALLLHYSNAFFSGFWIYFKLALVICLVYFNFYLGRVMLDFKDGRNNKGDKYFRVINEIPTVIMILIVFLVIVKPF